MSRIKWERAKFIALGGNVGIPADWPERFSPASIAALQKTSPGEFRAWQDAIESAVKAGELPSVPQVFVFVSAVRAYGGAIGAALDGFPYLEQTVPEYRQTLPAIAADDFRRWLESQGEKPSEHIQAWFDAWPESERVRAENREVQAQWARIQDGHKRWERHEARIQADLQEKLAPAPPPRVEPLTAPATEASISMPTNRGVIELPAGTTHVRFEELPHLIASALVPIDESSSDEHVWHFSEAEVMLHGELNAAVESGELPAKNPRTFGPYMPNCGVRLADCVVLVQDLRQYVTKRGLSVEVAETEAEHETEREKTPPHGRTWRDVSFSYVCDVLVESKSTSAKALYSMLERKAGPYSPFDKGTGNNLGSLFVREIYQPLSLKTLQNAWAEIKAGTQKD